MSALHIFLLLLILYVAAVAAGAWLVLSAERRALHLQQVKLATSDLLAAQIVMLVNVCAAATCFRLNSTKCVVQSADHLRQRGKSTALVTMLLLTPAILAALLASRSVLDGYRVDAGETNPVVAALLQGEHLGSPPPLPPDVFVTREIGLEGGNLADADREWNLLDSDFRQRLLAVYRMMATQGYQMTLIEGYRSPQRQATLAKLAPQVTNAGAYQSYHQYGLAADSAFFRHGHIVISAKDPRVMEGYRLFGKYAESVGLTWGGQWKMMDLGHVEMHKQHFNKTIIVN